MSNILNISVGTFAQFDAPYTKVCVIATDSYSQDVLTFDDKDHLLECYPTKEDLITTVLRLDVFDGCAAFAEDGSYQLDECTSVIVQGFPE